MTFALLQVCPSPGYLRVRATRVCLHHQGDHPRASQVNGILTLTVLRQNTSVIYCFPDTGLTVPHPIELLACLLWDDNGACLIKQITSLTAYIL